MSKVVYFQVSLQIIFSYVFFNDDCRPLGSNNCFYPNHTMDQLNWGSLLLKLIKTVVEFMIDVLAGVMLGKSALSPPLKSF
uniref:Uncharacterized protein n=1 Tax=Tetranychus urticae TaxID=32264 RepID=T1KW78_TETUR